MSETNGSAAIDIDRALRNITNELQGSPVAYRRFGIWWWPVKLVLQHAGLFPQVPGLDNIPKGAAPYMDAEQSADVPKAGLQETLQAALAEYEINARFGRPNGEVETPDGEVVTIYDPDMGI